MTGSYSWSVVIPTLGRGDLLNETLTSLSRCEPLPEEVIVVDGDGAAADVVRRFPSLGIKHIRSERGSSFQRNVGIENATGDLLLFLDDDVEAEPDTLAVLSRAYSDPDVVGATGRVIEPGGGRLIGKTSRLRRGLFGGGREGGFTRFGYPRRVVDEREQDIEFMQGCFMSARRDHARAVGFDTALPGYGLAEDEDFSYRLSRRGRIRYLPDISIRHRNVGLLTGDQRTFGRKVIVNRAYLFRKNFETSWPARIQFALFVFVLIGHRLLNREWAGARGLVDGAFEAWKMRK